MEKLKKGKHDHSLTDWLKFGIFGLVMLAPIFAILTECLMIICNKNSISAYTGNIEEVFYNAVDRISTKSLFNWTTSTGIYTPINNMITGLGITNNTISILLTYWALMVSVYIVFDIIIWVFTKLTHFTQD